MNEKLKFPLILDDGKIISTVKGAEVFFLKREQEANEKLCAYSINSKSDILESSNCLGSGLNGYGIDLMYGEE